MLLYIKHELPLKTNILKLVNVGIMLTNNINLYHLTTTHKKETLSSSPILNSLLARNVASLSHKRFIISIILATFLNM